MSGELRSPSDAAAIDLVAAGHRGDAAAARSALAAPEPRLRAIAFGALDRVGALTDDELASGVDDDDASVRRRCVELAATHPAVALRHRLDDDDPLVVEMTAWSLGERAHGDDDDIAALAAVATGHDDVLCREAAVAALGALGQRGGLPAVLAGCRDVATVRRRAVIALAAFDGPEVEDALQAALDDRDRQVRQAAEDLLAE